MLACGQARRRAGDEGYDPRFGPTSPGRLIGAQPRLRRLRAGGARLLAEPAGHVSAEAFESELRAAAAAGLTQQERPPIRGSRTTLLVKAVD